MSATKEGEEILEKVTLADKGGRGFLANADSTDKNPVKKGKKNFFLYN